MNFDSSSQSSGERDLPNFVDRFLEYHDAVLERRGAGLEALLPENLSKLLETPEHIYIPRDPISVQSAGEAASPPESVFPINYGSELLEKIINAVCTQVPLLACQLEFNYLKSQGFDGLVKESFKFFGAVGKIESWAAINTDYIFLTCKYLAQSDEQKEGLFSLAFNLETGASVPDMVEVSYLAAKTYPRQGHLYHWKDEQAQKLMTWINIGGRDAVIKEITQFQESMNRRFRRDVENLEEYYSSLEKEMTSSLEKSGLSDGSIEDRKEKIAQIPEELTRKKEDLFKKYSIRVKIEPCTVMVVSTPAVKILYRASIGKKTKNLSIIYNPAIKALDPLICQGCAFSTSLVHFCDRLHLLCPACSSQCPVCRADSNSHSR